MMRPHFLVEPTRKGHVGERVSEGLGRPIGRVGVPHVDMQEPVRTGGISAEPLRGNASDLIGRLEATRP